MQYLLTRSLLVVSVLGLVGCQTRQLVPVPNLYGPTGNDPFVDVPVSNQGNEIDVLYLTDRIPDAYEEDYVQYGVGRSHSVAWGSAIVTMGADLDWPTLMSASRDTKRSVPIPVEVTAVRESGRFPDTPAPFEWIDGQWQAGEAYNEELAESQAAFLDELRDRLTSSDVKEAYIMVHGFNNKLESGVLTIAELWHFMGREGVPMAYSWPAGQPGPLKGYSRDRESSEFTVFHLKEAIRLLATCEELEGIHIIGHSRGTDVVVSAIRELEIEARATGNSAARQYRVRNVILAAPDLDMDVIGQRMVADRIVGADRVTVYVSQNDKAINAASTAFGSTRRLGQVQVEDFNEKEQEVLSKASRFHFIDAATKTDFLNHGYFHNNPAVSSDVILVLKYSEDPGAENGRPLERLGANFWRIHADYPVFETKPEEN